MKKVNVFSIMFVLAMLIGGIASAQVKKLEIKNTSPCDVFITVRMSVVSATPTCTAGSTSNVIQIAAGGSLGLSADASPGSSDHIPGMPTGYTGYILGINGLDGPTTCISSAVTVGESSCGYTSIDVIYTKDVSCSACDYVKFQWTTIEPNIHAVLRVNP